jgi:hypothetical protein
MAIRVRPLCFLSHLGTPGLCYSSCGIFCRGRQMQRRESDDGPAKRLVHTKKERKARRARAPATGTNPKQLLNQRTRERDEALEQQAATSEILTVISRSPANVQPVLDTIVRAAVKLCNSHDAVVLLRDSDRLRIAAHHGHLAAASSIGCRSMFTISQPRVRSFPWVAIFRCG